LLEVTRIYAEAAPAASAFGQDPKAEELLVDAGPVRRR
jgi:hypothetical protein